MAKVKKEKTATIAATVYAPIAVEVKTPVVPSAQDVRAKAAAERAHQKNVEKQRQKDLNKACDLAAEYKKLNDAVKEQEAKADSLKQQIIDLVQPIAKDDKKFRFGEFTLIKSDGKACVKNKVSDAIMDACLATLPEDAFEQRVNWKYVYKRPELLKKVNKIGVVVDKSPIYKIN
jgi:septal ring factor EnvC (AmiA/AmiB activator)